MNTSAGMPGVIGLMSKAVILFMNKSYNRNIKMTKMKLLFTILCCITATVSSMAQELPNIIIIYADDLGYGDLSCYNDQSAYKTPQLDEMANEGVRFTDAHSPSTICSR